MSSHGLGLASSAGLSWDVGRCSLGRELASLPRVQPVSGLSGADRVNWPPSKGSPGPLSLLTVFTSWLLTGQQHSKKESGGGTVLEAEVKANPCHFCGCLLVQTRYPQVPDLGEVGRHSVVIFNLSGKATISRPKGLGRNQVTGAPHT